MYTDNDWRSYQELYHHGVLGQKWGVRRYQNSDGSLTSEGKRHYQSKYSDQNRQKLVNRINTARKIGSVAGGVVGAGAGVAADVAITLGTGFIAPYLQVMLPITASSIGANAVASVIDRIGDGARGNLCIVWDRCRSGHSVVWEIQNGQLVILDGQVNKVYKDPYAILKRTTGDFIYARTDNLDFDPKTIQRCCKS